MSPADWMEQNCQSKLEHFRHKQIIFFHRRFKWQLWTVEVIKPWTSMWPTGPFSSEPYASCLCRDVPVYQRACQVMFIVSVLQSPYTLLLKNGMWADELWINKQKRTQCCQELQPQFGQTEGITTGARSRYYDLTFYTSLNHVLGTETTSLKPSVEETRVYIFPPNLKRTDT